MNDFDEKSGKTPENSARSRKKSSESREAQEGSAENQKKFRDKRSKDNPSKKRRRRKHQKTTVRQAIWRHTVNELPSEIELLRKRNNLDGSPEIRNIVEESVVNESGEESKQTSKSSKSSRAKSDRSSRKSSRSRKDKSSRSKRDELSKKLSKPTSKIPYKSKDVPSLNSRSEASSRSKSDRSARSKSDRSARSKSDRSARSKSDRSSRSKRSRRVSKKSSKSGHSENKRASKSRDGGLSSKSKDKKSTKDKSKKSTRTDRKPKKIKNKDLVASEDRNIPQSPKWEESDDNFDYFLFDQKVSSCINTYKKNLFLDEGNPDQYALPQNPVKKESEEKLQLSQLKARLNDIKNEKKVVKIVKPTPPEPDAIRTERKTAINVEERPLVINDNNKIASMIGSAYDNLQKTLLKQKKRGITVDVEKDDKTQQKGDTFVGKEMSLKRKNNENGDNKSEDGKSKDSESDEIYDQMKTELWFDDVSPEPSPSPSPQKLKVFDEDNSKSLHDKNADKQDLEKYLESLSSASSVPEKTESPVSADESKITMNDSLVRELEEEIKTGKQFDYNDFIKSHIDYPDSSGTEDAGQESNHPDGTGVYENGDISLKAEPIDIIVEPEQPGSPEVDDDSPPPSYQLDEPITAAVGTMSEIIADDKLRMAINNLISSSESSSKEAVTSIEEESFSENYIPTPEPEVSIAATLAENIVGGRILDAVINLLNDDKPVETDKIEARKSPFEKEELPSQNENVGIKEIVNRSEHITEQLDGTEKSSLLPEASTGEILTNNIASGNFIEAVNELLGNDAEQPEVEPSLQEEEDHPSENMEDEMDCAVDEPMVKELSVSEKKENYQGGAKKRPETFYKQDDFSEILKHPPKDTIEQEDSVLERLNEVGEKLKKSWQVGSDKDGLDPYIDNDDKSVRTGKRKRIKKWRAEHERLQEGVKQSFQQNKEPPHPKKNEVAKKAEVKQPKSKKLVPKEEEIVKLPEAKDKDQDYFSDSSAISEMTPISGVSSVTSSEITEWTYTITEKPVAPLPVEDNLKGVVTFPSQSSSSTSYTSLEDYESSEYSSVTDSESDEDDSSSAYDSFSNVTSSNSEWSSTDDSSSEYSSSTSSSSINASFEYGKMADIDHKDRKKCMSREKRLKTYNLSDKDWFWETCMRDDAFEDSDLEDAMDSLNLPNYDEYLKESEDTRDDQEEFSSQIWYHLCGDSDLYQLGVSPLIMSTAASTPCCACCFCCACCQGEAAKSSSSRPSTQSTIASQLSKCSSCKCPRKGLSGIFDSIFSTAKSSVRGQSSRLSTTVSSLLSQQITNLKSKNVKRAPLKRLTSSRVSSLKLKEKTYPGLTTRESSVPPFRKGDTRLTKDPAHEAQRNIFNSYFNKSSQIKVTQSMSALDYSEAENSVVEEEAILNKPFCVTPSSVTTNNVIIAEATVNKRYNLLLDKLNYSVLGKEGLDERTKVRVDEQKCDNLDEMLVESVEEELRQCNALVLTRDFEYFVSLDKRSGGKNEASSQELLTSSATSYGDTLDEPKRNHVREFKEIINNTNNLLEGPSTNFNIFLEGYNQPLLRDDNPDNKRDRQLSFNEINSNLSMDYAPKYLPAEFDYDSVQGGVTGDNAFEDNDLEDAMDSLNLPNYEEYLKESEDTRNDQEEFSSQIWYHLCGDSDLYQLGISPLIMSTAASTPCCACWLLLCLLSRGSRQKSK